MESEARPGPLITRRRLLAAAGLVPVTAGVVALAFGAQTAARLLRPAADATSATICAACGSHDHSMLDPRCPRAPGASRSTRRARG